MNELIHGINFDWWRKARRDGGSNTPTNKRAHLTMMDDKPPANWGATQSSLPRNTEYDCKPSTFSFANAGEIVGSLGVEGR